MADLNSKAIVTAGGKGPTFFPFKEEVRVEFTVLCIKDRDTRNMGPHTQAYLKIDESSNHNVVPVGREYSIPYQLNSNNADQVSAASGDLRGLLCAMEGVEFGDVNFDANGALAECKAATDDLEMRAGFEQAKRADGKVRRTYFPVA